MEQHAGQLPCAKRGAKRRAERPDASVADGAPRRRPALSSSRACARTDACTDACADACTQERTDAHADARARTAIIDDTTNDADVERFVELLCALLRVLKRREAHWIRRRPSATLVHVHGVQKFLFSFVDALGAGRPAGPVEEALRVFMPHVCPFDDDAIQACFLHDSVTPRDELDGDAGDALRFSRALRDDIRAHPDRTFLQDAYRRVLKRLALEILPLRLAER